MSKLTIVGNIAIMEYPPVNDPEFDLHKDGRLFVWGYEMILAGQVIRKALEFKTNLVNYTAIGKLDYAKTVIFGNIEEVINKVGIDKNNCVIMAKSDSIIDN